MTIRIILRFGYEKVTKLELIHDPAGKIFPIYQKKQCGTRKNFCSDLAGYQKLTTFNFIKKT